MQEDNIYKLQTDIDNYLLKNNELKLEIKRCRLIQISQINLPSIEKTEKKLNRSLFTESINRHNGTLSQIKSLEDEFENSCNNNTFIIKHFNIFKGDHNDKYNNITIPEFVKLLLSSQSINGGKIRRKPRKTIKKHKRKNKTNRRKSRTF